MQIIEENKSTLHKFKTRTRHYQAVYGPYNTIKHRPVTVTTYKVSKNVIEIKSPVTLLLEVNPGDVVLGYNF